MHAHLRHLRQDVGVGNDGLYFGEVAWITRQPCVGGWRYDADATLTSRFRDLGELAAIAEGRRAEADVDQRRPNVDGVL